MPEATETLPNELHRIVEKLIVEDESLSARLPPKPEEPFPSDCCGTSCEPCIFDIYRSDLQDWGLRCLQILQPEKYAGFSLCKTIAQASTSDGFTFEPSSYHTLEVADIISHSPDTWLYRIKLPRDDKRLSIPLGSHIILRLYSQEGTSVSKQYTPVIHSDQVGSFDLLIKLYEHGKMSSLLKNLKPGQKVDIRGPFGHFSYNANMYSHVLMLACGTGITPMFQVIEKVLADPDEMTKLRLLFASRNYDSIYFKNKFKEWLRYWNFTACYFLSRETDTSQARYGEDVKYGKIDKTVVAEELKKIQTPDNCLVLVCGSNSFVKDMINYVAKNGISVKRLFKF